MKPAQASLGTVPARCLLTGGGAALVVVGVALAWTIDASAAIAELEVDAGKVIGTIRSFQDVNCGPAPLVPGKLADVTTQYRELRIALVRTHDFFGPADVDARRLDPDRIARAVGASGENAIFRDWNADPEDERSYHFGPSDHVIKAIVDSGAEVYYRLGRSWSADPAPPPDFDKFARVCQHIAMHYNDGWAQGFHFKIRYWEVWNEPDVKSAWDPSFVRPFWSGTPDQYYRLYEKVARALKGYDPGLQVGGCAQAAGGHRGPYREGFLAYCAANRVPLDFFSWHYYHPPPTNPMDLLSIGKEVRQLLDRNGFKQAESHVTEWGLRRGSPDRANPDSAVGAAFVAAVMINLQDSVVDHAFNYRGDATSEGLFNRVGDFRKKAYVFKAAGAMLDTPQRLAVTGGEGRDIAVLAGRSADSKKVQVLVANLRNHDSCRLTIQHLPWGRGPFQIKRYRLSDTDRFEPPLESTGQDCKIEITSQLAAPSVEFMVLQPQ